MKSEDSPLHIHRPKPVALPDELGTKIGTEWLSTIGSFHFDDLHQAFHPESPSAKNSSPKYKVLPHISREDFIVHLSNVKGLPRNCIDAWLNILSDTDTGLVDFRRFLASAAAVRFAKEAVREGYVDSEHEEENETEEGGRNLLVRRLLGLYGRSPDMVIGFPQLREAVRDILRLPQLMSPSVSENDSPEELDAAVRRLWTGRGQDTTIDFSEFLDVLSRLDLPAGEGGKLWPSMSVGRSSVPMPFLSINGEAVSKGSLLSETDEEARSVWWYETTEELSVWQCEVGLRKRLRQRVAQDGAKVLVEVFGASEGGGMARGSPPGEEMQGDGDGGGEGKEAQVRGGEGGAVSGKGGELAISETTLLLHDNNYRCSWPDLKETPASFPKGIRVQFTLLGGSHAGANGVEEAREDGAATAAGSEWKGPQWEVTEEKASLRMSRGSDEAGVLGKRKLEDQLAADSSSVLEAQAAAAIPAAEGAGPAPQRPGGGKATYVAAHAEYARSESPGSPGQAARSGGGTGGGGGEEPSGFKAVVRRSIRDTLDPPRSPTLGARRTPWKLASHTVKLNRYQGTVERFESLWSFAPRGGGGGEGEGGGGTSSGLHTPRSLRPMTPTGQTSSSPIPFESPSRTDSPSHEPAHPRPTFTSAKAEPKESGGAPRGAEGAEGEGKTPGPGVAHGGGHHSGTAFEMQSAPNQLLEALRFFELPLPEKQKPAFCWGQQAEAQLQLLARYIQTVARDVRKLCLAEPRCVHVRAPCYILGDLHGNYLDLIAFEKALWRIGLALSPANFLFLGDYVDRGQHSLEVITYLLAQKALCPGKIVLLRGNHEMRVQNSFPAYNPCFKASCTAVFGDALGSQVWECINAAFDVFPMAAIVDGSIFCTHGGIPSSDVLPRGPGCKGVQHLVSHINRIPKDLPQPDPTQGDGSLLAWDLMWNDPAPSDQDGSAAGESSVAADGFGPNMGRGTAHVFSAKALENFLRDFGLSHLVRAHEVRKAGFQVQQHSQMVTIFSSSGYCGSTNEASCILACEGKIRFIRLEHSLQPALFSLASKAAAASSIVAALATGVQIPRMHFAGAPAQGGKATGAGGEGVGSSGASAEESEDMAAAASLAAAAVDNSKFRQHPVAEAGGGECHNPQQRLQQRIQQRLQERLKECLRTSMAELKNAGSSSRPEAEKAKDALEEKEKEEKPKEGRRTRSSSAAGLEDRSRNGEAEAIRESGGEGSRAGLRRSVRQRGGSVETAVRRGGRRGGSSPDGDADVAAALVAAALDTARDGAA